MTAGPEIALADRIAHVLKLPFFVAFKLIVAVLNLIPVKVYEAQSVHTRADKDRPDLREIHTHIKGKRRLHLGSLLIAHQRGAVFRANAAPEHSFWGIYTEDYEDIQKKWTF